MSNTERPVYFCEHCDGVLDESDRCGTCRKISKRQPVSDKNCAHCGQKLSDSNSFRNPFGEWSHLFCSEEVSNTERPTRPKGWCICGESSCVDAMMNANKADAYMDALEQRNRELTTAAADNESFRNRITELEAAFDNAVDPGLADRLSDLETEVTDE